jgi:hypothetical protein
VGDYQGVVHLLRRETGAFAARARTDSSGIAAEPVRVERGFLVQTAQRRPDCHSTREVDVLPWSTSMTPTLVIVGRPNVGKSTLFNRLTRSRDALVADMPGLTRDRHYGHGRLGRAPYLVVDTGGFEPNAKEGILPRWRSRPRRPSPRPTCCCSSSMAAPA